MNIDIYRIFNAVGDSIILCSLIKALDVKTITYTRAELGVMQEIMKIYDIDVEFKQRTDQGSPYKMVDYVRYLYDNKIPLAKPDLSVNGFYTTRQLNSPQNNAQDRSMSMREYKKFVQYNDLASYDVAEKKTIRDLYDLMTGSKHHITIDSGTAWLSASMGIQTTIYSKNSYYFADAYHYMKYIDIHPNVEVYQQDGKGVSVANQMQFNMAVQTNGAVVGSYEQYRNQVNERSRIRG